MNKHELFDLIGEADEDYVLAADRPVKRARPRWPAWAACAACAALVIGAYPVYNALRPQPLHSYTVVEDGSTGVVPQSTIKAPALGGEEGPAPDPIPDPPDPGPDMPFDPDDTEPVQIGIPSQREAIAQYDNLMRNGGIPNSTPSSEEQYPTWYGGSWLDNDWPDNTARLTVAIVDGFRTPELEAQILEWCGGTGDVLFCNTKYSYGYLRSLQERLSQSFFAERIPRIPCSYGVIMSANCLSLDIYTDTAPESLLAVLAELDPAGDAIQVQVHTGQAINTDIVKGPPPAEPAADPVAPEDRAAPIDGSDNASLPGGAQIGQSADETEKALPDRDETGVPAQYDTLPAVVNALPTVAEELPEAKCGPLSLDE